MSNTLKHSVLIVDDDLQFRVSLGKAFAKEGYGVEVAADGTEALKAVRESSYDLVIADQKMPGMSGLELLFEIRKASPRSKIIFVTAYGDANVAHRAKEAGAFGYLDKPVKREQILSLAASALGTSQT